MKFIKPTLSLIFITLIIAAAFSINKFYKNYKEDTKVEYFVDSYSEDIKVTHQTDLTNLKIKNEFTIILTGDVSFVGLTGETIENDGADPFQFIRDDLKKYDL